MDEERPETFADVHRLRRNWFLPVGGLLAILVGLGLWTVTNTLLPVIGSFLIWIGAWIAPITFVRNSFPLARKATAQASEKELVVDNQRSIAVEDIMEARAVPRAIRPGETVVELKVKRRGTVALSLSPADATRLLSVLGVAAGERRSTFTLILSYATRFAWTCGLVGVPWFLVSLVMSRGEVLPVFVLVPFGILPVCALIAMGIGFVRGKVTVGAEGFTTSWYGIKEFHKFAEVGHIARKTKGIGGSVVDTIVETTKKTRIQLSVLDAPDTHAQRGAETRAFAETIAQAFERWRRAPAVAELGTHLGRGQRTAKEWLAGIDQLVRGAGNHYRVGAMTPEVLSDLTRGSDGSVDIRIGAAVALLRLNDQAHRSTVRIAAEASAEPKIRVALLALVEASDDDAALEAALARVR